MDFNVREHGALGDGKTLDTQAIQKTIDLCAKGGGGKVLLPRGNYLSGKLWIRSNVTVEISEGAIITVSSDQNNYPADMGWEGSSLKYSELIRKENPNKRWALFYACNQHNIGIIGRGTIEGNSNKYMKLYEDNSPRWHLKAGGFKRRLAIPEFRPFIVNFENCTDVVLDGVKYLNTPFYATAFRYCQHINIRNVQVYNDPGAENGDGLHFHSCTDVSVSDCYIKSGDDCIAIDSNDGTPSENYTITNCTFYTTVNCIRIYTSLIGNEQRRKSINFGEIRDISISNCVADMASTVLCINADRGRVERVSLQNICGDLRDLGSAFFLSTHEGEIDSVLMNNLNFKCNGVGVVFGDGQNSITNIMLSNARFLVEPVTKLFGNGIFGEIKRIPSGMPLYYEYTHFTPYFLQIKRANGIRLSNISMEWGNADIDDIHEILDRSLHCEDWPRHEYKAEPDWPALLIQEAENVDAFGLHCGAFGDKYSAIKLEKVKNANFVSCRNANGGKDFIEYENCENIHNLNELT